MIPGWALWGALACARFDPGDPAGPPADTAAETGQIDSADTGDSAETGESGETGDSSETGDSGGGGRPRACVQGALVEGLPEPGASQDGSLFRIFQVPHDDFDELYVVLAHPPSGPTAYEAGAPVVVSAMPSLDVQQAWATRPTTYFSPGFGVVEVQPVYPGWEVAGTVTTGPLDDGGDRTAAALIAAIRFATGELATVDGHTIDALVPTAICNSQVAVVGASGGGITAMNALRSPELVGRVLGFAGYENPSLPQYVVGDAGMVWMDPDDSVDADGDGFAWDDGRNLSFDPESCATAGCEMDYSRIAWAPDINPGSVWSGLAGPDTPNGLLYLDRNGTGALDMGSSQSDWSDADGDGAIELSEDAVLLPKNLEGGDSTRHIYSPEATAAAEATLGDWPAHLASAGEARTFWETRNMASMVADAMAASDPGLPVSLVFTEVPHGPAQPGHEYLTLLYQELLAAGASVRFNGPLAVARCFRSEEGLAGYTGGSEPGLPLDEVGDLYQYDFPEDIPAQTSRALGTLGLVWEAWGPFDNCPATD